MNTTKRARLFLVDDHILVLESCKKLLEPHHDIVGEAHDASDLVSQIRQTKPDILLMDITMPDQNGYEAARVLKIACPSVKIIFVSMHLEPIFIMEAFRAGGVGYVPKQTAGSELLIAIQQVQEKQRYLSPLIPEEVQNAVLAQMDGMPGTELSGKLTPRQQEVLKLVAQGIANVLTISQSTVAFHKMQIVQALGLHSKADLTKYAVKLGISPLD